MNNGGDAAEQVVRLSLEGVEVIARLSGTAAKEAAIMLAAAVKSNVQTKGKTRLVNMLKSGEPLDIYSVRNKDLPAFMKEAKRYGIMFTVLRDKDITDPEAVVDIMGKANDGPRFQRIMEKMEMAHVTKAELEQVKKEISNPDKALAEKENLSEQESKAAHTRKYSVKEKLQSCKDRVNEINKHIKNPITEREVR